MLFPDLNLAEGRNLVTGSKPKAQTFSSVILMVLPNKESFYLISNKFFYLTLTIQDTKDSAARHPLAPGTARRTAGVEAAGYEFYSFI